MVFSSIVFLLYFLPAFLILYFLADRKYKNLVILFSSIFFYTWGAPKFIFVILATTVADFYLVRWMSRLEKKNQRRLVLTLSVTLNLGLLVYFKYSNFFIDNMNSLLSIFGSSTVQWSKLILPIGISFYTFETITYVVDVYRRIHKPLNNFWDYQLYIILFPKLIAGPIIRYHELADQINDRSNNENLDNRLIGFYRFVVGLAKKVLIANQLGGEADRIFAMEYSGIDSFTAWTGILAFSFQLYFDFSGYSDMAIGLARMIGFKFPENFNNPYIAGSITEFWRRWHITLGQWMRNYLYIPLGGNKVDSKSRLYMNLWIVFLASGLWHGASWSFIIWGAYHGLFIVLERIYLLKFYKRIGKLLSTIITFFIVVVGWVFFRVEEVTEALRYLARMFSFDFVQSFTINPELIVFLALAVIFSFSAYFKAGRKLQEAFYLQAYSSKKHVAMALLSVLLFILCISSISSSGFNPFIYFRF